MSVKSLWNRIELVTWLLVASKPNITSLALDANQFGEAGCEEICKILEEAGKSKIMEPFEDDEEPDDEDDDEGVRNKQWNVLSDSFGNMYYSYKPPIKAESYKQYLGHSSLTN